MVEARRSIVTVGDGLLGQSRGGLQREAAGAADGTQRGVGIERVGKQAVAVEERVEPLADEFAAEAVGEQVAARGVVDLGRLGQAIVGVVQGRRGVAVDNIALLRGVRIVGVVGGDTAGPSAAGKLAACSVAPSTTPCANLIRLRRDHRLVNRGAVRSWPLPS